MRLTFTVYGVPQPQGSARAFMPKGARFPVVTSDNPKLKPWRQEITAVALMEMKKQKLQLLATAPVYIDVAFYFLKPKSAKKDAIWKTTKPDFDKLIRGLCDGLTGVVFRDDAQVCQCFVTKKFGEPSRTQVVITAPYEG